MSDAPFEPDLSIGSPASGRRGIVYLALTLLLAGILLATTYWPQSGSTAGQTCEAGTAIYRLDVARDIQGNSTCWRSWDRQAG